MTYLTGITIFHTALSLVAIVAGAWAVLDLFRRDVSRFWTRLFLATATVTSVTGFMFPFKGITPAQVVGVIALVILAGVLLAYYRFHLDRAWRWIYAGGMVASLYLLVFVGIVQAFQKIAILNGFAPTGSEPPFIVAQAVTLIGFIALGIVAARTYRPGIGALAG